MAVKLSGLGGVITNPKGVRTRDSDLAIWNTAGTPAFETYNAANIADYGIVAAEMGATGIYSFTDPVDTVPGRFVLIAAAGANLTVADVRNNVFWENVAGPFALTSGQRDAITAAMLDLVNTIEPGITLRQAIRALLTRAGLLSGAGTGTEVMKAFGQGPGGVVRLTYTVDPSGNITAVTLNL